MPTSFSRSLRSLEADRFGGSDRVYSGVPAGEFGLEQRIEVGPMSGLSNVHYWLSSRGLPVEDALVEAIFQKAKASNRVLDDAEIEQVAREFGERA